MIWLLRILFACSHPRTTWPQTTKRRTYIVCLDCGQEFEYNWNEMRVTEPTPARIGEQRKATA